MSVGAREKHQKALEVHETMMGEDRHGFTTVSAFTS